MENKRIELNEETKERPEEAKKSLEQIEKEIKPYIRKRPLILTSTFEQWKDASDPSSHL